MGFVFIDMNINGWGYECILCRRLEFLICRRLVCFHVGEDGIGKRLFFLGGSLTSCASFSLPVESNKTELLSFSDPDDSEDSSTAS